MSDLAAGFQTLPEEYQETIRLAQQQHKITITPLQALTGGYSGALIYLVSVAHNGTDRVEHFVMKLDRINEKAKGDEIRRHTDAVRLSPPDFAGQHIAQMMFERVEHGGRVAIFYAIAGQSLHQFRPISAFDRQNQLETLITETYGHLLEGWNTGHTIRQNVAARALLEEWLGFRIRPGGSLENFLTAVCGVPAEIPGLLVQGNIFPNPLAYARDDSLWEGARPLDVSVGLQHSDLNTNNVLVKFDRGGERLEGFYLIDFALFKEQMPLFYDLRYLEACFLVFQTPQAPLSARLELITRLGEEDMIDPQQVPIDAAGFCAIINTSRQAFDRWIGSHHPTLRDDLWGQYLLAGAAAGLNFTHKANLTHEERLIGLVFAAANLKRFAALFGIAAPTAGRDIALPGMQRLDKTSSPVRPASPAAWANGERTPNNLPAAYSSFIGREAELAAARSLLAAPAVRLITFSGPGGVGKTRLALQTALAALDDFPDGVYLVQLAEVTDPEMVVPRIAQALGVRATSRPLLETLNDFLYDKRMLLILDNLEQIIGAAAIIPGLLSNSPGLKVLATSRIVLRVRGEHEFPVPPMKVPEANGPVSVQPLEMYESVQLFIDRARAANSLFVFSNENAPAITEICRRLEGLPLAIELAAARIKMFTPEALLGRLNNRLAVLTGGARDLPARQQALRATLDWSYSLLSAQEQVLFARLGIFAGGFSLEGAEAVCNEDGALDLLAGIEALIDNSLLRQEAGIDGQPRFRMLETMREYALERLKERGELNDVQERHAAYYINKITHDVKLFSPQSIYWLDWLESEHDNLLAMLAWAMTDPDGAETITRIGALLVWFWYRRGFFEEGHAWTEQWLALMQNQGPTICRALALQNSALMTGWRGDLKTALARNEESLRILMQIEDDALVANGMFTLGVMHINMGNDAVAHPLIKEAQQMFDEAGNMFFRAVSLVHLGNVSLGLGNPNEAREWLMKAHALLTDYPEKWVISFVLNNLGEVARVQGDYASARRYYEESEALLRAMGDKGDLARLVSSLGYVAYHEGDQEEARKKFLESLTMFRRLGNKRGIAEVLAGLAGLRLLEGQAREAAQLLGVAEAMMNANGAAWWPADRVEIDRNRAAIEATLGDDVFAAELAKGRAMRFEQAIALALAAGQRERA